MYKIIDNFETLQPDTVAPLLRKIIYPVLVYIQHRRNSRRMRNKGKSKIRRTDDSREN